MGLTRRAKLFIAFGGLIVLVGIAYIAGNPGVSFNGIFSWIQGSGKQLSQEKVTVRIFSGNHNGGTVYDVVGETIQPLELLASGTLIEYTRTPDHLVEAFIFRPQGMLATHVSVQKETETNILLGDPSTIKSGIVVSPDASLIAYAELTEPMQSTLYTPDVTKWDIVVVDVATQKQTVLGAGVAPFFLGNSRTVMYSSLEGLVIYALDTGKRNVLSEFAITQLDEAAKGSPDGQYLAVFNKTNRRYAIFELYQMEPPRLSALGGLDHQYEHLALTNTGILGLSDISGTKRLFAKSYDNIRNGGFREEVFLFAQDVNPTRIIP